MYKLSCSANGRFYIGFTNDVERRYGQHRRKPPPGMAHDCTLFTPFTQFFSIQVLQSDIPLLAVAKRREAHHISVLQPVYNEAPPEGSRAWWYRKRHGCLFA